MSNVKGHKGGSSVPGIYEGEGHPGAPKLPPETISHELSHASGKAKMNFKHPPLGPEQHYEGGEEHHGRGREEGEHEPKHRSTSGAPGHSIAGA